MLDVVDEARVLAAAGHAAWTEPFSELFAQVAGVFAEASSRRWGRAYLLGLLSQVEQKNGWTIAELADEWPSAGMQRRRPRVHDIRHYVDGWVMRAAVAFPLLGAAELVLQSA
jgi:SRSO17 transposase